MPVEVFITRDFDHMSEVGAQFAIRTIKQTLRIKNDCALGLATGNSPTGLYKHLAKAANQNVFDSSRIRSFNLDEYVGLPGANAQERVLHPESYSYFMIQNLFGILQNKFTETQVPAGALIDQHELEKALSEHPQDWRERGTDNGKAIAIVAKPKSAYLAWIKKEILDRYVRLIKKCGGIDLQIIGVGGRGHVAFHEVGIPLSAGKMLLVKLDEDTVQNAVRDGHFSSVKKSPHYAISMGIELVFQAKAVLLLANGKRKIEPITRSLCEPYSPDLPISYGEVYAQKGGRLIYVVDKTAGKELLKHRANLRSNGVKVRDISKQKAKISIASL